MTPKEKAIELVTKYYGHFTSHMSIAKKIALIAVDEIIDVLNQIHWVIVDKDFKYWQEVKKEIEKL